ncbi:MAG TPA: hypothetical protein VIK33_10425 [Anaerolineae bacterium]
MSSPKDETERLKRIRAQQLAARDPLKKDRTFYGMVSQRGKKNRLTLGSILKDFESKWTWMFVGGIIGTIVALVFVALVNTSWATLVAIVLIFAGLIIGRLMGAVMDWRNDDWQRK